MNNRSKIKLGIYTAIENHDVAAGAGFEFIEENIQTFLVPEQNQRTFNTRLSRLRGARVPVLAANRFFPASLKCVGDTVDRPRLHDYTQTVFKRAEQAGVKILVLGSGASRALPAGYPADKARQQFADLLLDCLSLAEQHQVTLAIEPLSRTECNFINSLAEGAGFADCFHHPRLRLMADFYHMDIDGEPMTEIERFQQFIVHTHISERESLARVFPGKHQTDVVPFLAALIRSRFDGMLTVECDWSNLKIDSPVCFHYLTAQMNQAAAQASIGGTDRSATVK